MKDRTAINTSEIGVGYNGELPVWVQLIPAGQVVGRDGRSWNNSQPEKIVSAFTELARDLPIDIEHSTELKGPKGEPAPAIGWVKELEARNGEIYGRVEWNGAGRRLVGGREYRYLSPVIIYQPESGTIIGLTSVGVTNQPNLKLPALNRQMDIAKEGETLKEEKMLNGILAALGLPETTTEAEAVVKIGNMKSELASAMNRAENPSLEKFVPRADFDAALAKATNAEQQLTAIKGEQLETAINSAIAAALKDGKITPATADYHKAQCRQDGGLDRFAAYCAAAPALGGDSELGKRKPEGDSKALNAQEKEICTALGISEEDYLKTSC